MPVLRVVENHRPVRRILVVREQSGRLRYLVWMYACGIRVYRPLAD